MSGNECNPASNAQMAAGAAASAQLLPPQRLLQPVPMVAMAVIAIGFAAGMAFMLGDRPGTEVAGEGAQRDKVFSLSADQTTGAFRILPDNFQKTPGSVLAQLSMPETEKARLAEKLADGSVRLAAVTVWDTVDEDGDAVDVTAAGFSQRLVIMHKPVTFFLPVQPGAAS